MKCEQFEDLLNHECDNRRDPGLNEALLGHAKSCFDCRLVLGAYTQIQTFVSLERQVETNNSKHVLAGDFSDRVLQSFASLRSSDGANQPSVLADIIDEVPTKNSKTVSAQASPSIAPLQLKHGKQVKINRRDYSSNLGNWVVAVALVGFIALPIAGLILTNVGPKSNAGPGGVAQVENPPTTSHALALNGGEVPTESEPASFLGPHPFCTGGNLAIVVSQLPNPVEQLGMEPIQAEIPAMNPITKSFESLFRVFIRSVRPLSGGKSKNKSGAGQSGSLRVPMLHVA